MSSNIMLDAWIVIMIWTAPSSEANVALNERKLDEVVI